MLITRQIHKIIKGYIPSFFDLLEQITDFRQRKDYEKSELITGCIAMFLFKETSRNAFNNDRSEAKFRNNYFKIFKKRLPHMDTVDTFLKHVTATELEQLKASLVSALIEQKILRRFKLFGKSYMIAVDATCIGTFSQNDEEGSLTYKKSKAGKTTYSRYVLEAKLVTSSGLAISLATEWITNEPERNYNKQDCEQKAFVRLAVTLKKYFPRLPICILADGLYPNKTFMKICENNGWEYIVVLKDDNLKRLQEDLIDIENKHRRTKNTLIVTAKGKQHIDQKHEWLTETLQHDEHKVNWFCCTETITCYDKNPTEHKTTKFVFITSMETNNKAINHLAQAGRRRWKIENEGFNEQKNHGYNLEHKYSRLSFTACKNYYQCLQIAHIINQLVENSVEVAAILEANTKLTIKHLWKNLIGFLTFMVVNESDFDIRTHFQIRLTD